MCKDCEYSVYPLPTRRSYRTLMKNTTKRKLSSTTRINVNKFWNQLEDFNTRREEELRDMETIECNLEVEKVFQNDSGIFLDESDDELSYHSAAGSVDSSCYCSATSSSPSPVSFYSYPLPSPPPALPRPPKSLPLPPSFNQTKPLIQLMENLKSWTICTAV